MSSAHGPPFSSRQVLFYKMNSKDMRCGNNHTVASGIVKGSILSESLDKLSVNPHITSKRRNRADIWLEPRLRGTGGRLAFLRRGDLPRYNRRSEAKSYGNA